MAGAGLYVDTRFVEAAVTHTGEMSLRAGTARYVVAQMEQGRSPAEAVHAACRDLMSLQAGAWGPLVVHAVNPKGDAYASAVNIAKPVEYQFWREGMEKPEKRTALPVVF